MIEAKLSSKNQIVIPREARQALRVKAGDRLLIVVRDERVLVLQKPESHAAALHGLARSTYRKGHLNRERESWE